MDAYQTYIALSRYARYLPEEGRRETWPETVARWCNFWQQRYPQGEFPRDLIEPAILDLHAMPSMRGLMTAGPALANDHIAGYNCSMTPILSIHSFSEILYILMCGTGVGFSVENYHIRQLPPVPSLLAHSSHTIHVKDSKYGWAKAFHQLLVFLYAGFIPKWDVSKVRPAGARLRTLGGRASGPKPLVRLFKFTIQKFQQASKEKRNLTSLDVHDIVCKIAEVVVCGGVRRSALISLSDLDDELMREAKNGAWWEDNPQRALANNSAIYTERPEQSVLAAEWKSLYESKSGERGIFNRQGAIAKVASLGTRDPNHEFGTNPCGEVILRPQGLCNLSEVIIRPTDTLQDLQRKVEIATIIGTFQSTLTDFKYLSRMWKHNAEEERLLGVSLTGIMDHPVLSQISPEAAFWLHSLRYHARGVNRKWATLLGINPSAAITTVKPSGTVSQLVGCSSGIHPAYSRHYIRTVRADNKDPLTALLKSQGVPNELDITNPQATVFSFPRKSAPESRLRTQISALEQLDHYLMVRNSWCDHNPSITVYVREAEWDSVLDWVSAHFDEVGGVSFLPYSDHVYQQAPYQPITEAQYEEAVAAFPSLDFSLLPLFEKEDQTTAHHELACTASHCEL